MKYLSKWAPGERPTSTVRRRVPQCQPNAQILELAAANMAIEGGVEIETATGETAGPAIGSC